MLIRELPLTGTWTQPPVRWRPPAIQRERAAPRGGRSDRSTPGRVEFHIVSVAPVAPGRLLRAGGERG
jgi:hypothetical protein